jgi:AraC-type DNA-binding domain-containing proteins
MIKFYTYGKKYAPKGWPISYRPYANRLYYIYGGIAYFLNGAQEYRLKPHHLYVFPHSLEFRVRQEDNNPLDHLFFDFVITPPFSFHELVEIKINDNSLIGYTVAALSCLFTQYDGIDNDPDITRLIRSYFENLLLLVSKEKQMTQLSDMRLLTVIEYIHKHYDKPISTRELAFMVNMEENHFIRTFKKEMFITPYQYLREYRLNIAASFLETGMSVFETAIRVGYENTSSFSNALKKSRGVYPTELMNPAFS